MGALWLASEQREAQMPTSGDETTVTAAEISRSFGEWQSKALTKRVVITHYGKARLVLLSVEELDKLQVPQTEKVIDDVEIRSSARINGVLSQIDESFCALDANLNVTDINRAGECYFGIAKADLIGRSVRESILSTPDSLLWSRLKNLLRTGTGFEISYRSLLYPGSTVHMRAFPYNAGAGVLFRTEANDQGKYQELWSALQAAVCTDPTRAVLRLNVRGGISVVHDHFCAMTGFSRDRLKTLLLTEIVHPHERLRLSKSINSALRLSSAKPEIYHFLTKEGGERRLRLTMGAASEVPIPDSLLVLVVDIDGESSAA